jgi:hypothetical protein
MVPGPLSLNRLCSNNSAFQVDRGVSEGFSVELARDREDLVRKRYINCSRLTAIGDTLGDY